MKHLPDTGTLVNTMQGPALSMWGGDLSYFFGGCIALIVGVAIIDYRKGKLGRGTTIFGCAVVAILIVAWIAYATGLVP